MFKGFREFVLRGNVVDLAVGVVIGAAFGDSGHRIRKGSAHAVDRRHSPASQTSRPIPSDHGAKFLYGDFLNALIPFS